MLRMTIADNAKCGGVALTHAVLQRRTVRFLVLWQSRRHVPDQFVSSCTPSYLRMMCRRFLCWAFTLRGMKYFVFSLDPCPAGARHDPAQLRGLLHRSAPSRGQHLGPEVLYRIVSAALPKVHFCNILCRYASSRGGWKGPLSWMATAFYPAINAMAYRYLRCAPEDIQWFAALVAPASHKPAL
jgi:hypothetical protein